MILLRYLHREELLLLSRLILEIEGDQMSAKFLVILLILWVEDKEDKVKPRIVDCQSKNIKLSGISIYDL